MTSLTWYHPPAGGHVWRQRCRHCDHVCNRTTLDICGIKRLGGIWRWWSDNTSARIKYWRYLWIIWNHRRLLRWSCHGCRWGPVTRTWVSVWGGLSVHMRWTWHTWWSYRYLGESFTFSPLCSTVLKPNLRHTNIKISKLDHLYCIRVVIWIKFSIYEKFKRQDLKARLALTPTT